MNHKTFYFLQCWLTVNTFTYSAQIIQFPHFSKLRFVLKDSSFIHIFERFYNLASLRMLVVFTPGEVFVCLFVVYIANSQTYSQGFQKIRRKIKIHIIKNMSKLFLWSARYLGKLQTSVLYAGSPFLVTGD